MTHSKTFLRSLLILVLMQGNSSFLKADVQTPGPDATTLQKEVRDLETAWVQEKKDYAKKLDELIKKIQTGISERDSALDRGDAALRKQINEERKDLERHRDRLKRRLAEVSAANAVDWVKVKEEIHDTVLDLTD
jgi:hypothetical protein